MSSRFAVAVTLTAMGQQGLQVATGLTFQDAVSKEEALGKAVVDAMGQGMQLNSYVIEPVNDGEGVTVAPALPPSAEAA